MLRNPYIAGVERFEMPFSASAQAAELRHPKEQAAHFCLLLWRHFQPELRAMRYTISCDHLADTTVEFTQPPRYHDLIGFDANAAQQIDIEFISQQRDLTSRNAHAEFGQKDEYFPAFLEVFIPLARNHAPSGLSASEHRSGGHLVIWCRPNLLPKVTALWERAATLLFNQL